MLNEIPSKIAIENGRRIRKKTKIMAVKAQIDLKMNLKLLSPKSRTTTETNKGDVTGQISLRKCS